MTRSKREATKKQGKAKPSQEIKRNEKKNKKIKNQNKNKKIKKPNKNNFFGNLALSSSI
jgi:hypothetical protein